MFKLILLYYHFYLLLTTAGTNVDVLDAKTGHIHLWIFFAANIKPLKIKEAFEGWIFITNFKINFGTQKVMLWDGMLLLCAAKKYLI